MTAWVDLEHSLWRELKEQELQSETILVGFSGGVDSLALLWALWRVKKQSSVEACYVHHGEGSEIEYRDQALHFCESFCQQQGIPFHTQRYIGQGGVVLNSEAELREFRYQALRKVQAHAGSRVLALAHHRDDLLETRLMRLIRGTGPQGLGAMQVLQDQILRPFLRVSKQDLSQYLKLFNLQPLKDPSNDNRDPFRNWLRHSWLQALEERQAGSVKALARSLELIVEAQSEGSSAEIIFEHGWLSRPEYLALSKAEQKRVLARFILSQNVRDFTQSQVQEIQKRLDNPQKGFTFRVAGLVWIVNAQQIRVQDSD